MTRIRTSWKIRDHVFTIGERTLIMGVVNVTPDSFSDGGKYLDPDEAAAKALEMEEQGADIIDIGAESTRPGAERISAAEELRRLIPVLKRLKNRLNIPISVDTYKAEVAEKALEHGAAAINDISALTWEPEIVKPVVKYNAGLVLNHMRGTPETWAKLGPMKDVMGILVSELEAAVHRASQGGVERDRLVIDPGIGFGKRGTQNSEILARLGELQKLLLPVLVAASRKSFLGQQDPSALEFATAAAVTTAILNGAAIVRVHEIAGMKAVVQTADAIVEAMPEKPEKPDRQERRVEKPRTPRQEIQIPRERPAAIVPPVREIAKPREEAKQREENRQSDRPSRPFERRGADSSRPERKAYEGRPPSSGDRKDQKPYERRGPSKFGQGRPPASGDRKDQRPYERRGPSKFGQGRPPASGDRRDEKPYERRGPSKFGQGRPPASGDRRDEKPYERRGPSKFGQGRPPASGDRRDEKPYERRGPSKFGQGRPPASGDRRDEKPYERRGASKFGQGRPPASSDRKDEKPYERRGPAKFSGGAKRTGAKRPFGTKRTGPPTKRSGPPPRRGPRRED